MNEIERALGLSSTQRVDLVCSLNESESSTCL
jgi:hypothetical protein